MPPSGCTCTTHPSTESLRGHQKVAKPLGAILFLVKLEWLVLTAHPSQSPWPSSLELSSVLGGGPGMGSVHSSTHRAPPHLCSPPHMLCSIAYPCHPPDHEASGCRTCCFHLIAWPREKAGVAVQWARTEWGEK